MQKYLKLQQLGFKQKQKNGEKNLSEGLKVRLASGWAQSVNFMLGIDAEPPTACVVGLRSIGKILYVYISIQLLYTYVYVHTDTNNHYTTHACNRHGNKEGNTQPEQQALALRTCSTPELGFVPPSLGNSNILLTQNAKCFPKQLT